MYQFVLMVWSPGNAKKWLQDPIKDFEDPTKCVSRCRIQSGRKISQWFIEAIPKVFHMRIDWTIIQFCKQQKGLNRW